ncbi:MAG TPA: hypothetical protein VMW16_12940 [Sedimentisphaerales bacterium]|nr:hypothetical protein [Sedimentisphaerales bacterium]
MTNGAIAAAVAGGATEEIARAIKASGAIIRVESADFETILSRSQNPLVVYYEGGFFSTSYQYLLGYKGLVFYCKTATPLMLPAKIELIRAKKIWIPT